MPASLKLLEFGEHIRRAFGHTPYQVGSSMSNAGYRDVDVRMILADEEYLPYGDPKNPWHNKKWVSTVLAWSEFGKVLTGLPIDFQIQQRTWANEKEGGRTRNALFRPSDCVAAVTCPKCNVCNCDHGELAAREVQRDVFSVIEGLEPVDPEALLPFQKEMIERVIPEIVEAMKRRAEGAVRDRQRVIG
jgi:hypothetical protein